MRDIKYRGWNTEQNIMYSAKELGQDELTIDPDGRGFVNVCSSDKKCSEYYSHILPLQYTSLKDKNGVEIYEEDIVRIPMHLAKDDPAYGYYFYEGIIKYKTNCLVVCFFDENVDIDFSWDEFEIIGNIYENPELLE